MIALLVAVLFSGVFVDQQRVDSNTLAFYVNVAASDRDLCVQVITEASNGYVAFKTGDIPARTTNYVVSWTRDHLRPGTYTTTAYLMTECSDDGEQVGIARAPVVRL